MASRINNIAIPISDSPCQSWKNYYHELEREYGAENAQEGWLYTWEKDGNTDCTKSREFNRWASENNIAVADGIDQAIVGVSSIGQNILNGIGTMTGLAPKVGVAVALGGTALGLYLLYKFAREVKPADVVSALPQGRAAKLLGGLK